MANTLARITGVKARDRFRLAVTWDDGKKATADLTGLVHRSGHFKVFVEHPEAFRKVRPVEWGSGIEWENGLDFSSESLRMIADEQKPMRPKDFKDTIERLDLNYDEVANILGCSVKTIRNYRTTGFSEELPQPWAATLRRCETDKTFFAAVYKPVAKQPRGRPKA